eukprot:Blabericola_migrator_1__5958@NODE_3001_length_2123_cov_73_734436_g744_i1_p1_GENE_NODE_3001_length_2123_cov_73_734436_g744_i1NODE_3001_length_2123_cov_73_734436_g744_i1_p1_ORF_typecomplete_len353_score63_64FAD_binding_1/PF00667_20/3_5e06_NODE_3001_length_2123_cov_73_734436_g744_i1921150
MNHVDIYYTNNSVEAFNASQDVGQRLLAVGFEGQVFVKPLSSFRPAALVKASLIVLVLADSGLTTYRQRQVGSQFLSCLLASPNAKAWCKFTTFGIGCPGTDNPYPWSARLVKIAKTHGWEFACDPGLGDLKSSFSLLCQLDLWMDECLLPYLGLPLESLEDDEEEDDDERGPDVDTSLITLESPLGLALDAEPEVGTVVKTSEPVASDPRLEKAVKILTDDTRYIEFTVQNNDKHMLELTSDKISQDDLHNLVHLDVWPANDQQIVSSFFDCLADTSLKDAQVSVLKESSSRLQGFHGLSVMYIFQHLLDGQASPSRGLLYEMSGFFGGMYRAKLKELSAFNRVCERCVNL